MGVSAGAAILAHSAGITPAILTNSQLAKEDTGKKEVSTASSALKGAEFANASAFILQGALDGTTFPKYSDVPADRLPVFGPAGIPRIDAISDTNLHIDNTEIQESILPADFYTGIANPVSPFYLNPLDPYLQSFIDFTQIPYYQAGTTCWAYRIATKGESNYSIANYPALTIESKRNKTVKVIYHNSLKDTVLQDYITVDQSIHWANPLNRMMTDPINLLPYKGPVPVVTHLHGAEVPSTSDGGPDAWFTPDLAQKGPAWKLGVNNQYSYPNTQQSGTLFYHDHVLGATRTNLYSGLVGFYFIRDEYDTGKVDNPLHLPGGPYEIEIAVQDKMFDITGQLLFPDGSSIPPPPSSPTPWAPIVPGFNGPPPNPSVHPWWIPEFFGDFMLVNGKSWPVFHVEPRRYRFRMVNGSNARCLHLWLSVTADPLSTGWDPTPSGAPVPSDVLPIYVIGADGGLLDNVAKRNEWQICSGEREDFIVDFTGLDGKTIFMKNNAATPFPSGGGGPGGDVPLGSDGFLTSPSTQFQNSVGQVMKFIVDTPFDNSVQEYTDVTVDGKQLRGGLGQPSAIVRLSTGLTGQIAPGVVINKKRMLTLVENEGPGGPLDPLVNNTKWDGRLVDGSAPGSGYLKVGDNYLSELPKIGSTEEWDIVNLTMDAHPIHLHLVQFQILNRQEFNRDGSVSQPEGYRAFWNKSFKGGTYIPENGPPLPYDTLNAAGFVGGNPDVTPWLLGDIKYPDTDEIGWKDTFHMYPMQVTRVLVRFSPQDVPVGGVQPGQNLFTFDPTKGPGYVWHCHIVDHEDNEMMRPYKPVF